VLRLLSAGPILLLVLACSHPQPEPPAPRQPPEPAPPPAPVIQRVTDTVMVKDPEMQRQVDRLELRLAERDARISELESRVEAAQSEVVRMLARAQGTASRAEAASGIAEAELATQTPRGASSADVAQAKRLLRQGTEAFNAGNYAGAVYLADQAKALVAPGRRAAVADLPPRAGEKTFASPVPFKTSRRANVREGPGPGFKVLFTAKAGMKLTGYSYTDEWVRVADESGRAGWIFKALLSRP
jgi:hypothetical protein